MRHACASCPWSCRSACSSAAPSWMRNRPWPWLIDAVGSQVTSNEKEVYAHAIQLNCEMTTQSKTLKNWESRSELICFSLHAFHRQPRHQFTSLRHRSYVSEVHSPHVERIGFATYSRYVRVGGLDHERTHAWGRKITVTVGFLTSYP